jgi:hypothetical protein
MTTFCFGVYLVNKSMAQRVRGGGRVVSDRIQIRKWIRNIVGVVSAIRDLLQWEREEGNVGKG